MNQKQVVSLLLAEIDKAGSERAWAEAHKISNTYVNFVLKGACPPGPKMLNALGIIKVVSYEKVK